MYIDSHCHLDRLDLTEFNHNIDNVVANASAAGVSKMLCVSVTLEDFPSMVEKTQAYDNVMLTCGVHPLNQEHVTNIDQLQSLASHERVIAIGETGLDYFYAPETKQLQQDAFVKHIHVAKQLNKPLIIHTRDAREDTLNTFRQEQADQVGGILHCFTESWEMAKAAIDMGFYISFSGIVTFKNAHELREVAKKVPADRFLIETDSPYLAPVPHRGKQNQPAFVVEVAKHLASIRGESVDAIAEQSTNNFNQLFNLS